MISEIRHGIKSNFLSHVLSDNGMGYVHSIFENSFNIIFNEELFHFGKQNTGTSAFGLLIPNNHMNALLGALQINDRLKVHSVTFTLYTHTKTWKIKLTSFDTVDCRVPEIKLMNQEFLSELLKKMKSIHIEDKTGILDSQDNRILTNQFLDASWDNQSFQERFIAHFIGRGIGLTPSGDDMLMGILMIYYASGFEKRQNWTATLRTQLTLTNTTDVSMAYYHALIKGYTSSFFVDFLQAIREEDLTNWDKLIDQISKYGHTSGWDTLYGIYLFLQKLEKSHTM